MEIKGIDVSGYNTNGKDKNNNPIPIDWKQVKASGIEFAIPKIIRKDLNPDKQFENNWRGCKSNNIAFGGVYNYSYADSVDKAIVDANKVVQTLDGRKTVVWMDVEDKLLKGKGIELIRIINAYENIIKQAGLEFGVYTGLSFYKTNIKPYEKYINWKMWIARYGKNTGRIIPSNKPSIGRTMAGWQYSSKGKVPGIVGNVDMNVFYSGVDTVQTESIIYPILRIGDHNAYVLAWQKYLNLIGYNCGKEDGIFGSRTELAVIHFQEQNGLDQNGVIGINTWMAVNN